MDPQTSASTPDSNWLSTLHFNRDTLRSAQDADPDVSTARQWIQARQRPPFQTIVGEGTYLKFLHAQFPALEIHQGLVIRRLERPNTPDRRQVLLPAPLRTEALQMAHAERTAGHLGTTRTLAALHHRFLWPLMRRDVQFAIAACDTF